MSNEFLWVEKYRPQRVADTILPSELKNTFQKIIIFSTKLDYLFNEKI